MIDRLDDDMLVNLINYYDNAQAMLVTKNKHSQMFKTCIGVKQGGPLSPRLFALYLEGLVDDIESTGAGIQIGHTRVNILLYADDIILLANNHRELQNKVQVTKRYGKKHEITFNPKKTVYTQFGGKHTEESLQLDDTQITKSAELRYLGVKLTTKMTPVTHLDHRKRAVMGRLSALRAIGLNSP